MMSFVRLLLLAIILVLSVEVVIGVVSTDTGALEKVVLAACGVLLVFAAARVRRFGRPQPPGP
jgi:hypothetical protein